jgi:monoamine oxidase
MSIKRKDQLDTEEALELELLYAPRPERPQPAPLGLPQNCLKQVQSTRVAVIGAGLAGLMAALVLCRYGAKVTVIEAYKEVGGRVRSNTRFSKARITEEGAELIGSFHNKWLGLAQQYGLAMISRMDPDLYRKAGLDVQLKLEDKPLTMEEFRKLEKEMEDRVLKPMAELAKERIRFPSQPWLERDDQLKPDLIRFDGISVQKALTDIFKIAERTKGNKDALLWKMLDFKLVNDEVAPLDKMNFLGLLCKVRGGQNERFGGGLGSNLMGYWNELEIFRCADGCQQLAKKMEEEINGKVDCQVRLQRIVKLIDISSKGVRLLVSPCTIKDEERLVVGKAEVVPSAKEAPFDFVILAIPPSVWDKPDNVSIKVGGKPIHLKDNPGIMSMQPAVKFFSNVKERFWIKKRAAPYGGTSKLGQVWEGTDNQTQVREIPGLPAKPPLKVEQGIVLSVFAGPILPDGNAPTRVGCIKELIRLYPGYTVNVKDTLFSNWPANPLIRTGYASPQIDQVLTVGKRLNDPLYNRLFFAGEHTDMAFFGYMEGALRSGEQAAKALMMKKCGLLKEPATQPPSQTFVARAAPTREYAPFQQEVGIASEGELDAGQGWKKLEEDQLMLQPDEEGISLETEAVETEAAPLNEPGIELRSRDTREVLDGRGAAVVPQKILFVSAELGDKFKHATQLVCQGHDVMAISPRATAPARAFRRIGGQFIRGRVEDLPLEACRFDLIRENHPYPSERHYLSARPFALARLSRLRKGGRWIVVTESPRHASLLKAIGDYDEGVQRNFTVTASSLAPDQAPSTLYRGRKARFRLIFQRRR